MGTSKLACKLCMAGKGLRMSGPGSDLFDTQEELNTHVEAAHHMPIRQPGESDEQTIERFLRAHPEARVCEDCRNSGAVWTRWEQ